MRKAFHMTTAVAVAVLTLLVAPAASGQARPDPRPPDAFLSSSSGEVKGEFYHFCWTEADPSGGPGATVGQCADRFQVIVPDRAVVVDQGQFLTLRFDPAIRPDSIAGSLRGPPPPVPAPPSIPPVFPPLIQRFQVPADTPTRFRADFPPGTYTLLFDVRWRGAPPAPPYGDALYVFELTVTPRPAPGRLPPEVREAMARLHEAARDLRVRDGLVEQRRATFLASRAALVAALREMAAVPRGAGPSSESR